jgi:hypothetical protein
MKARVMVVTLLVLCGLAGCGGGDPSGTDGTGTLGDAPASASATTSSTGVPTAAAPPSDTTGHSAGNPLSCRQLPGALVGTAAIPLADYDPGTVQLSGGRFDGPGGLVELQEPCGIGDLNRDGVFDAIGVVKITAGGTGRFYTLVAWLSDNSGVPQLAASKALGDRNPVETITIASNQATVVYLTRTPEVPLAGLNLRRTAIFGLTDTGLTELSHVDAPYTP